MVKHIYNIVKKIPGFAFAVKTEFHVINQEVYVREFNPMSNVYRQVRRVSDFDNFNFDAFVDMGMMTKEVASIPDYQYKVGDLVVYNKYGQEYFDSSFNIYCKIKNEVCTVISNPILRGKNVAYIDIKNVMDGTVHHVKTKELKTLSKKYWFIDSHGDIQMTYFWLRPIEDKYRIANHNCFVSYDAAERGREDIKKKEMKNLDELKDFVYRWKS